MILNFKNYNFLFSYRRTPFWAFAWEFKKKMNKKGHNIYSDQQLREMVGPHWNKLSKEEQEKYISIAKNSPSIPNTNRVLLNSFGQPLAEIEAQREQAREDAQNMVKDIEELLDQANSIGGKSRYHFQIL